MRALLSVKRCTARTHVVLLLLTPLAVPCVLPLILVLRALDLLDVIRYMQTGPGVWWCGGSAAWCSAVGLFVTSEVGWTGRRLSNHPSFRPSEAVRPVISVPIAADSRVLAGVNKLMRVCA